MSKKENIKIIIAIIVSLLFFGIFILTLHITPRKISPPPDFKNLTYETKENTIKTDQSILEINDTKYESEVVGVISVYQLMEQLKEEGKINFKDKTYTGMGKFIEEINGVKNSGEKNWIYYVNGKKANIGVSNYKIKPGDVVSWKYENNY